MSKEKNKITEFSKRLIIEDIKRFCETQTPKGGVGEQGLDELADKILSFSKDYVSKDKIKEIRDKAEVMDYYSLNDVIDDLSKLIGDYKDE
jgi:hypothetical protein